MRQIPPTLPDSPSPSRVARALVARPWPSFHSFSRRALSTCCSCHATLAEDNTASPLSALRSPNVSRPTESDDTPLRVAPCTTTTRGGSRTAASFLDRLRSSTIELPAIVSSCARKRTQHNHRQKTYGVTMHKVAAYTCARIQQVLLTKVRTIPCSVLSSMYLRSRRVTWAGDFDSRLPPPVPKTAGARLVQETGVARV